MGKSIQFHGRESLVNGFINTGAPGWSVWDGRDMLTKGTGSDMLNQFLEALEEGSTNTIYTLKIYEDINDPKKIKMGTDPDGSFKFLLTGEADEITHPIYSQRNNSNRLFQRLELIEQNQLKITEALASINGTDGEDQEPEPPQTIGAVVMEIIQSPTKLKEYVEIGNMVKALLFSPPANLAAIPATIGHVNTDPPVNDENAVARAQTAISILEKNDPNLVAHLETLAALSESDPTQFNFMCSLLDKMKK